MRKKYNIFLGILSILFSIFLGVGVYRRDFHGSNIETIILYMIIGFFFIFGIGIMFSKVEPEKRNGVEYTTGLTYNDAEYWRFNHGRKKKKKKN